MNDELHLWSGLYATDALDDAERARFEAHLAECADCQAEVAGFRETVGELAAAAAEPAPPAARDRILAMIAETRQDPPPLVAVPSHDDPAHDDPAPGDSQVPGVVTQLDARRRRPSWTWLAVAAAFVVLAGASIATVVRLDQRATRAEQIAAVVGRADARTVELRGERGVARVVWSPSSQQAVFLAEGLAAVDTSKTYELWVIRDGTPRQAALVRPDDDGVVRRRFATSVRDGDVLGVTVEPAAGSAAPTTPVVMSSAPV